jgi:predicted ATPase/class 3 adenylate cyclase
MTTSQQVEQVINILQAHRGILGDEMVETSAAALRKQLAEPDQLQAPRSSLAGERKQVTVMFADISGFTAMSEKLDPEEVRRIINACFERLGAVIERYDGHIDKFIGDEIMALFGAPLTHENDPERALRAALEMVIVLAAFNSEYADQIPQPLALHFGINSGLVIAGGIGTRHRQDYSVLGDPVNLASRLEGLSEAGEILVGEDTYRLAAPLFEFEALKPVKLKGKEKPVKVYRLRQAKTAPGQVRGIEGLSSPLVGREQEMEQLKAALGKLIDGKGSIISVIGEAGIGKSRLTRELYLECSNEPKVEHTIWARGRGLSYGENVSYLVARDLFCNLLEIDPEDSSAETSLILQSELERLFANRAIEVYPYLAHLLDLPLDEDTAQQLKDLAGEALHRRVLQSAQRYLAAKARQQPLVLVWEDLHWADPSSMELLEILLPLTQQSPLLLLMVYRPRRESRLWAFHQQVSQHSYDGHTCIELCPLTLEESNRLLRNLLGKCDIPEKTCQLLLAKAEGNPFFIEEVIRSLIDSGVIVRTEDQGWVITAGFDKIQIPDTLQGVIMARIDRLPPEVKRVLQVASVIGRNFSGQVLAQVLNKNRSLAKGKLEDAGSLMSKLLQHLQNLESVNLLSLRKSEPDREYGFTHIFTQESVYQSLLHTDRRQLHQQVGEALEAMFVPEITVPTGQPTGSGDDLSPLLAYHFQQSGDTERAVKYLTIAGDRASGAYTNQEAKEFYSQALILLPKADYGRRWENLAKREQILDRLGERELQSSDLLLMQTLAELMADEPCMAATHNRRAAYFDKISEYEAAAEAAEAGLWRARHADSARLEAQSLNLLALAAWRRFDYQTVKKWANEALDALRVVGNPADRITSLLHLGRASYRLGQYDAALDYVQAAQDLASYTNDREHDAVSELILGWIYQRLGDYGSAEKHYQAALGIRRRIGDRYGEATALSHLGWLARDHQRHQDGLRYCQEALAISKAIGDRENEAYALSGMGINHEQMDELDTAVVDYQEALAIQQDIGATTLAIFDQAGLARIAWRQGDFSAARKQIRPVVDWILAGKAQQFWDPWTIYQSAYELLTELGETETAGIILEEAHTVLHQRVGQISNQVLRERFLQNVTVNQQIEAAWHSRQKQDN